MLQMFSPLICLKGIPFIFARGLHTDVRGPVKDIFFTLCLSLFSQLAILFGTVLLIIVPRILTNLMSRVASCRLEKSGAWVVQGLGKGMNSAVSNAIESKAASFPGELVSLVWRSVIISEDLHVLPGG